MFSSEAGSYSSRGTFRFSLVGQAPGLTGLERPARDKHSSLFCPFLNFEKKVYNIDPRCRFFIIDKLECFSWARFFHDILLFVGIERVDYGITNT
jgi:hypothetical protein